MKKWISAAAVTAFAVTAVVMVFTAGASAGNGTGITATPAATKSFDFGASSATFARSASGIITEANRVAQNPWASADVWLQFRPLSNPTDGNHVVPNPTCDPTGLVAQVTYHGGTVGDEAITGNAATGYFLPNVTYNACVYLAHLTLTGNGSATSTTISPTGKVLYAGTYNGPTGVTVGLTVFHGHDCATGMDFYNDPSYTSTNASGNYSLLSGTPPGPGLYSAETNVGSNLSNCINIDVTS